MTTTKLSFNRQTMGLQDGDGLSCSLVDLQQKKATGNEAQFWQELPWKDSQINEINLLDLPCLLDGASLSLALSKLWKMCSADAIVKIRIPHPRHDQFLMDIGYVRGLLPVSFAQLDPRHSITGLAKQLGVNFEILESSYELDSHWQNAMTAPLEGQEPLNAEDIELISKQASNVIQWINITLQAKKTAWISTENSPLEPEMRQQLMEQIALNQARGNTEAVKVINNFLNQQPIENK